MHRPNSPVRAIVLFLLILGVAAAQTTSPVATALTPQQTSGMIGIVAGQTARLNALNPGVPAPLAAAARCPAQVSFLDDQGNVLKSGQILVDPGKSADLDFVMSNSGRLQIRAVITFGQTTPITNMGTSTAVPVSVCNLVPTLEVFDTASGKTEATLSDFRLIAFPLFTYGMTPGMGPR